MAVVTGCDPKDPGVTGGTVSEGTTGGGSDSEGMTGGGSEGTTTVPDTTTSLATTDGPGETTDGPDETTTGGGHDTDSGSTPEDFACEGGAWLFVDPEPSGAGQVSLAADGRARVFSFGLARQFDAAGTLVATAPIPSGAVHWDIDAAGNGYGMFRDEEGVSPRKWLRKFDPAGAMLWERDLGPRDQGYAWGYDIAVAADGTTVYSDRAAVGDGTRMVKHAADGTLLWDLEVEEQLEVTAIGASGAMAALVWNEGVRLLDASGAELWTRPWELSVLSTAAIDGAGAVVVGAEIGSSAVKIGKFAADGTPLWDTFIEEMWGFGDLAVNASGEIAVGGEYSNEPPFRAMVARLDGSGAKLAVYGCDSDSWEVDVAIDEAGTIFASGAVNFDAYHTFATAFE
ncbi:hypothetical protein [Nannocystis punicea]|uniref:Uncharacterized protein n=1 Tax=Nannocystis punicea TaxID=2995304 RepID=A0ABY7HG12_9BACT|nr:hypothetical protein [Nannocystis poenicansa]WAS98235.1 hypothetical protein O0S08_19005 [Nannocystis poenicansa]